MSNKKFVNPFRPGAGHKPPFLAGREVEKKDFLHHLRQDVLTDNPILSGLRGVGKTVLLEEFKQLAIKEHWLWVGTDMSESASLSEERIATRLLADLAVVTANLVVAREATAPMQIFDPKPTTRDVHLNFPRLSEMFQQQPGLTADKLKAVLEFVWRAMPKNKIRGIVFAYDEAQNLADHADRSEYPLSLVLEVFQSLQPKGVRFMLALTGLPTLFPKLVEARTSAERMFHVIALEKLTESASREAIEKPMHAAGFPFPIPPGLIDGIVRESGGYPYFLQFICREVYDLALQQVDTKQAFEPSIEDITRKLDADFFAGRWARATDRQRDLLRVIAELRTDDSEFTVLEIVEKAKQMASESIIPDAFSASHVNQMLSKLAASGFVYKNRHGKYLFAVPLLARFIRRQNGTES